jgi:hypothetical protein
MSNVVMQRDKHFIDDLYYIVENYVLTFSCQKLLIEQYEFNHQSICTTIAACCRDQGKNSITRK